MRFTVGITLLLHSRCALFLIFAIKKEYKPMNIHEINTQDLNGKSFVFRNMSELLGENFQKQSFILEGFTFNICINGNIKIKINYKEYWITAGNIFVILPKHIFSVLEYSPDLDIRIVCISMDFIHNLPTSPDFHLLKDMEMYPCAKIADWQQEDILKIYSVIERYNNDSDKVSELIQNSLTFSLVLIAASLFGNLSSCKKNIYSRQENLTRSFFDLLLQYYETERSVSFYADKLCITPKYLTMTIKAVTNHSVQCWINEAILIEAKRHINTSELTIQQISEKLHFPTASSFIRFFRTHVGYTPLEYRKKNKK